MSTLDSSPEIVRLANTLGICGHPTPSEAIVDYCLAKVRSWVAELQGDKIVDSLSGVEKIVCAKLRLKFEYIETDADVPQIENVYVSKGEPVIKNILQNLDEKTYGAVFERKNITKRDRDKYVAVIDCRGDKRARKFFTKWHEIAHLLTLKRQLELILFRDTETKNPEERLMDLIAAHVGFYPEIFKRAFEAEYAAYPHISFALVQRVRDNVCPDASFEATLNACLNEFPAPCLLVHAGMGLSVAEKQSVVTPTLFPIERPIECLRAVKISRNKMALDTKLTIHLNMRVPAESVVHRAFHQMEGASATEGHECIENMEIWSHSDGSRLSPRKVTVYTRPHGKSLLVLISLTPTPSLSHETIL